MEEFRAAHQRMFGVNQLKSIGKLAKLCEGEEREDENEMNNSTVTSVINSSTSSQSITTTFTNNMTSTSMQQQNPSRSQSTVPPPPPPPGSKRLITFSGGSSTNVIQDKKTNTVEQLKVCSSTSCSSSSASCTVPQVITNEKGETVKILRTSMPSKKGPAPPPPVKKSTLGVSSQHSEQKTIESTEAEYREMSILNGITQVKLVQAVEALDQLAIGNNPISIKVNLQLPTN